MRPKFYVTLALMVAISGGWFAGHLMSADPPKASDSDSLAKINAQIARAELHLAETELKVLVDANTKLANTFPRSAVMKLQQVVNAAKKRVEQADKADSHTMLASYVALTAAELNSADTNYRTALAANKQIKDAVPALELERLKITAELAKLRNDRAQQAGTASEVSLLSWQLDDLREKVRNISQQVELYRGNE